MSTSPVMNRWKVVVGAILIQMSLGAIYAWSVFTPALKAAGWSKLDTQLVFAVGLATFALVMVWAGRKLADWGPQRLAVTGGLVLASGYALSGLQGGTGFWPVCIGIGIIGGAGIGLGYVVPIAVGMRWFPDRKGMITGLAVAGFGFGAMGWVKVAGSWGQLIERIGLANTFLVYGLSFAVLVLIGAIWMRMPPEGWAPEGYVAPSTMAAGSKEFTPWEMLRSHNFYLIFMTFAISASAGLMSIGLMKLYPMEALQAAGYGMAEASAIAGTAMAVFFSLANGVGRIVWGTLSDHLGRRLSVIIMTGTQGLVLMIFSIVAGNEYMLYLSATLIGFNFGGNFALFPAFTADTFGNASVGRNYPFVFLSYGVGGIAGPIFGGMLGDMGDFPTAFGICGLACLLGAFLAMMVSHPQSDDS
jgi:OFA family oxalate/formate antiporter-like MFS transporter